jgi:hypothetical protein
MAANCFAAIQLAEQLTFALKVAATNK